MDLRMGPEYDAFRSQVREFLQRHRDRAPSASIGGRDQRELRQWQGILIEAGYAARTVPREYGGYGAEPDLLEAIIIDEEFAGANVYRGLESQGISMLVPTLLHFAREEQKIEYIGPTIRGETIWCQGYSEPGSGSDLASLQTRARIDGDDYIVNGQKIWTSTANEADMMFALVRTEAEAAKHAGISYLLLRMDTPGIEVRPLKTMTGDSTFNEVFFTDVRVPRSNLVGSPGQGWEVGTYTLRHERNMLGRSDQSETFLRSCISVLEDTGALDDPIFRDRLLRLQGRVLAMKYHGLRVLTDRLKGREPGVSALITKLNGCQINYDICALAIDALAEHGILRADSPHVRDAGAWQTQHMYSLGLIIGGGTAQIQKNIISEAGLGMPREPKAPTATNRD
jgi:alkylation response protein AidB-like acyl-CoA dehydrogenase